MMDNTNYFSEVVNDCLQVPKCMKIIKEKEQSFLLIWSCNSSLLSIYKIKEGNSSISFSGLSNNDLRFSASILDILNIQSMNFIFLINGLVYKLDSTHAISNSLENPMVISQDQEEVFKYIPFADLKQCDLVIISACLIKNGFVLFGKKMSAFTIQVYHFTDIFSKFDLPITIQSLQMTSAVFHSVLTGQISYDLKRCLFPDLKVVDEELVLVGFNNGVVGWFSTCRPNNGLQILCNLGQPIKLFHWISSPLNSQYLALLITLTNGLLKVIMVDGEQLSSHTLFLPGKVVAAVGVDHKIVTSDGINSSLNNIILGTTPTIESSTLHIKGVQSILEAGVIIFGTYSRSIYCINVSLCPIVSTSNFVMPEKYILHGIVYNNQELNKLNSLLQKEDMIIQILSTTSMILSLDRLFEITAVVYSCEKIEVTVKLVEDCFIFKSEYWFIHLEFNNSQQHFFSKLEHNLTHKSNLVVDVYGQVEVGCDLNCFLVTAVEDELPVLIIHLGKMHIDACYFLESNDLLQSKLSHTKYNELLLNNVYSNIYISLPDYIELESFYSLLLKDVQNSKGIIKIITDEKKRILHMKIYCNSIIFNIEEQDRIISIVCSDIDVCQQLKLSISKRFYPKENKHIGTRLFLEIQVYCFIINTYMQIYNVNFIYL
uniref:Uncharacterized protein n=1 Tax=Clastoptera arizonana TaxID=38151 RepID=A0A1B6CH67_9HEMI